MKYARISPNNVVIETFVPPAGFAIADCFHPDIASQFVPVPDEVEANWVKQADGSFVAPVAAAPIPQEPTPPDATDGDGA